MNKKIELCKRCGGKVTKKPALVMAGYYAYCPRCCEDMFSFETHIKKPTK